MSNLIATYNNTEKGASKVIEVPLDNSKTLTNNILDLKEQVNTFLTHILEQEKRSKVTTVEEDEIEKQEEQVDEEEDNFAKTADDNKHSFSEEQASKKLKTKA
ncbi:hypothetical protein [Parasitella parasitica]|uniref:EKC/KEOPS complex subunit GON7 n=1 Tax=Parasitella parasitica TaxID=35722 RepID=A0A0B7NC30_9FUNG|nr:hypothetical protein [Parasitella parasitica]